MHLYIICMNKYMIKGAPSYKGVSMKSDENTPYIYINIYICMYKHINIYAFIYNMYE
jgi:hypothetical protein